MNPRENCFRSVQHEESSQVGSVRRHNYHCKTCPYNPQDARCKAARSSYVSRENICMKNNQAQAASLWVKRIWILKHSGIIISIILSCETMHQHQHDCFWWINLIISMRWLNNYDRVRESTYNFMYLRQSHCSRGLPTRTKWLTKGWEHPPQCPPYSPNDTDQTERIGPGGRGPEPRRGLKPSPESRGILGKAGEKSRMWASSLSARQRYLIIFSNCMPILTHIQRYLWLTLFTKIVIPWYWKNK